MQEKWPGRHTSKQKNLIAILLASSLSLSAPTLVEMFLVSLVGMADMIQVCRVGPEAITAVGLTNQPIMLLLAIFQALNVGTTHWLPLHRDGKPKDASDTLKQTFVLVILLGLAVSFSQASPPRRYWNSWGRTRSHPRRDSLF